MSAEGALGSDDKESPMDFVLWKAAKPGEPSWESPWGAGRPGWHIECSAMSLKYLGNTLDIHGGGQDLVFPHHENEIAQSESFTGIKPFVKYWLHNGLVQLGEEKMSKSLGNLITIREALEKYSPDAIRIFVLSSHYRSPLTYSEEALEAAERGVERLRQTAHLQGGKIQLKVDFTIRDSRQRFVDAMDDDFNTAKALAALFDLAREINRLNEESFDVASTQQVLLVLAGVLGLTLEPREELPLDAEPFIELQKSTIAKIRRAKLEKVIEEVERLLHEQGADAQEATPYINLLREVRNALRKEKHFQLADEIRAKMGELGIILGDTPSDTIVKHKR